MTSALLCSHARERYALQATSINSHAPAMRLARTFRIVTNKYDVQSAADADEFTIAQSDHQKRGLDATITVHYWSTRKQSDIVRQRFKEKVVILSRAVALSLALPCTRDACLRLLSSANDRSLRTKPHHGPVLMRIRSSHVDATMFASRRMNGSISAQCQTLVDQTGCATEVYRQCQQTLVESGSVENRPDILRRALSEKSPSMTHPG